MHNLHRHLQHERTHLTRIKNKPANSEGTRRMKAVLVSRQQEVVDQIETFINVNSVVDIDQ